MSGTRPWAFVVTAEHGGNRVPSGFAGLFEGCEELLGSHRGWDPGTLQLSRRLAAALHARLFTSEVTRLLADLNRSPRNPRVFSERTRPLPRAEREAILRRWHEPHRSRVCRAIAGLLPQARVLHLAVHSFTPVWKGVERPVDLSLLYDPARPGERTLAHAWTRAMARRLPDRRIRRNTPYRGTSDGLTTWLRGRFPDRDYLGIEIEVNQRHLLPSRRFPAWVADALLDELPEALAGMDPPGPGLTA